MLMVADRLASFSMNVITFLLNIALAGALRRLPAHDPGSVVRIGQPVDAQLFGRPTPVLTEEIAAQRGQEIAQRVVELRARGNELRDDLKQLKQPGTASSAGSGTRLAIQRQLAEIDELIKQLSAALRDIRMQIVRDAQLVAVTASQCTLELLEGQRFDVVVIDKPGMPPTGLAMLVAGLGNGHTLVTGDFRQFSPVAIIRTPTRERPCRAGLPLPPLLR